MPVTRARLYRCTLFAIGSGQAKSFAPVKSHSAAIAYFQKVNLFNHLATQSLAVCMVRQAAIRKFGLSPKNRKTPFKCADIEMFATA
jgi:hypothetical protein